MQGPNGMQPPVSAIKLENPGGYYCNSYTPPAPDHSSMLPTGAYSKYQRHCNSQKIINTHKIIFVVLILI